MCKKLTTKVVAWSSSDRSRKSNRHRRDEVFELKTKMDMFLHFSPHNMGKLVGQKGVVSSFLPENHKTQKDPSQVPVFSVAEHH
jgi:hypothetical protein